MNLILTAIVTITASFIIVWALTKLIETIYNIMALRDAYRNPDETKQRQAIIYNKEAGKLEADQSPTTPF
jgi:hypothetical protein